MARLLRIFLFLSLSAALLWVGVTTSARYWKERNQVHYRTAKTIRRTVSLVVNSTGDIKPVLSVTIGSFVSGPITKLHVDFNDRVTKGQLLAEIDPRIYDAAVARDKASLITREADVDRVKAQLQQAINDEKRSIALRKENKDYISRAEMDKFRFARMSLEAQFKVSEATVLQAVATLSNSEANLAYTKILSPVDGIVIDRKIDPGQTLAAQFQTPELFILAPGMEKKMHVFASVDEADIGLIRRAQQANKPVEFTTQAYPDNVFTGEIEQVRFSSTENQNVVTYPVVVSASNPDLKLLPGMTAELTFQIDEHKNVLCVPNAALRLYPARERVRQEDHVLFDLDENETDSEANRNKRHVWIDEEGLLRAIEITTGISGNRYTEVLSGDLREDQAVVIDDTPLPGREE